MMADSTVWSLLSSIHEYLNPTTGIDMTAKKTGWLVAASLSIAIGTVHSAPPTEAKAVMIDSSASTLAATNRVAITSVMVSFQASAGGEKGMLALVKQ